MSDNPYAISKTMMCGWHSWLVMEAGKLGLVIPKTHSTDMTGCIATAKAIMPEVNKIYVFNVRVHADACEVVYAMTEQADGPPEWEAFDTRKIGK